MRIAAARITRRTRGGRAVAGSPSRYTIPMPRFQFTITDGLLVTAVAAAIVASIATKEAVVSFITLASLLAFVWHRAVLFRLWLTTATGLGAGLMTAMLYRGLIDHQYLSGFRMDTDELAGWGGGLVIGSLAAYRCFLSNPPRQPRD